MKKLLALALAVSLTVPLFADDIKVIGKDEMDTKSSISVSEILNSTYEAPIIKKIPSLKAGGYWSAVDNAWNHSEQVAVITKGAFSLNMGYAGKAENTGHKAIVSLSYDLGNLESHGFKVPILKHVGLEPFVCFGAGKLNVKEMDESETDFGFGINALQVRF